MVGWYVSKKGESPTRALISQKICELEIFAHLSRKTFLQGAVKAERSMAEFLNYSKFKSQK